jgi:Ser/Thr protein kinase RdoA (MazF antagonist)
MDPFDAALYVAQRHDLPVDSPVVLRNLTNVLVHLAPAPVVVRAPVTLARPRPPAWFAEELRLAQFLAAEGAPVAPPSDKVDPGPHHQDGFAITFWCWIDHDPARADPVAAGRSLRELHAALARYSGELPTCDRLDEVRNLLRALGLDELLDFANRLEALDGRPLHGDAHLSNVLWSPTGPLWSDLENACRGPVEYDLACLRYRGRPEAEEAIAAYGDHGDVDAVMPLLSLQLAAWTQLVAERSDNPAHHAEAQRRIERALAYAREM